MNTVSPETTTSLLERVQSDKIKAIPDSQKVIVHKDFSDLMVDNETPLLSKADGIEHFIKSGWKIRKGKKNTKEKYVPSLNINRMDEENY